MSDPVSPGVKLAVTLRHIASDDSNNTLLHHSAVHFSVASPTIKRFVPEVCDVSPGPIEIR